MTPTLRNAVYLNCPRCGLTISPKAEWLAIEHCPRCIARHRALVKLFASTLPTDELYAPGVRPSDDVLAQIVAGVDGPTGT